MLFTARFTWSERQEHRRELMNLASVGAECSVGLTCIANNYGAVVSHLNLEEEAVEVNGLQTL